MAKKQSSTQTDLDTFNDVKRHFDSGFNETNTRATGRNRVGTISFNEADELFRSWLNENTWPYDALLFDPRIYTFIMEKASRLIANKLRGRLIPREGGDVLAAKVNNELLQFQWDQADNGGTMLSKWQMMDMNTRKYGSAFALCKWRYETDEKGKVLFDGPEMGLINNRDFAHDLSATAMENANWVQIRQYVTLNELKHVNDQSRAKPIYKNLETLEAAIGNDVGNTSGGDSRSSNWTSRNRAIAGLEMDPVGKDIVFKTVEIITEYRRNRWITFSPKHGVILRDIPNPYENNEIPVTMLRYIAIDDDLYGLSEIEPIKGLQKAINALLSQYVDEINQKLYSPLAIGPGVRQHTLEWGKGARWIMNNPNSDIRVIESQSNAAHYFNQTYSVLVAAMLNALGESSLGVSNIGPMQQEKTATEVKAVTQQRNARDNANQLCLAEAIQRQMKLWHSMNQKLLFADPKRKNYIVRIVGKDAIEFFKQNGLDKTTLPDEALQLMQEKQTTDPTGYEVPKYPINTGDEKNPKFVSKLSMDKNGQGADLYLEPSDLEGNFDFIADVESMAVNSGDMEKESRAKAVSLLSTNPMVSQLLQVEGVKPKFKALFVSWLEDLGFSDADKYFESIPEGQTNPLAKGSQQDQVRESISINYKDAPAPIQRQMEQKAGLNISGGQQPGQGGQPVPNNLSAVAGQGM